MLADRTLCGEAVYTPQDGRYCEGGCESLALEAHATHILPPCMHVRNKG